MYKRLSYVRDIHIVAKTLAFLFLVTGLILLENKFFIFLVVGCFFLIFKNPIILGGELLLLILSFFIPLFLPILKFGLFVSMTFVFVLTIKIDEVRYFLEVVFYKRYPVSLSYHSLSFCYFGKFFYENIKSFYRIYQMYGKEVGLNEKWIILKKSYEKSKRDISSFKEAFQHRFYRTYRKRTYVERMDVTALDMKYVLVSVILLFLVFVYGR